MAFDKIIIDVIREYHVFVYNAFIIAAIMGTFIALCGVLRFGIAVYRRKKGIYPPAASQMEDH
jgi:hypothetical protein